MTPGCWLLARVAKKKPYLRLANKKKRLRCAKEQTLDRGTSRPASRSCLVPVDDENPVLQGLFQLAFQNEKLGLANTTCHWNRGVMVADNGALYAYVDIL